MQLLCLTQSNNRCCLVDLGAVLYAIDHRLQIDLPIGYLIVLFSAQSPLMRTPLEFKADSQDWKHTNLTL